MALDLRLSTMFLSQFRRANVCRLNNKTDRLCFFFCVSHRKDAAKPTEMERSQQNTKCQFSLQSYTDQCQSSKCN